MRMLLLSFTFFLMIIFLWFWFYTTSVDAVTSYFEENLEDLSYKIDNEKWEEAINDLLIYNEKWEEVRKLWIYFLNQDDVGDIDSSIRVLNSYINSLDKVLSKGEIERLIVLFKDVRDSERLSLENIF